ncbi:hypothetical protein BGZ49_003327 [Haplosporangium sp. Z 27]|nr:hypothetical protein BGZ49_003327 [Haplosporangium sp. Z 27]
MSLDKVYGSILRYRANLRMFSVVGNDVDPYWVFEGLRQEGDVQGWLCQDLESLEETLAWSKLNNRSQEQMSQQLMRVLRQTGRLSQLRHLSVKSQDLELYPALVFLEECYDLSELRTLVLSAPDTNHAWRVSQVDSLLHYFPQLVSLDLGHLTRCNAEKVQEWLDDKSEEEEEDRSEPEENGEDEEYEEYEEYDDDEEYEEYDDDEEY